MAGEAKLKAYNETINDFIKDCRDLIAHLQSFKKHIKVILHIKEQEIHYYKQFIDFLIKYEEVNTKRSANSNHEMITLLTGENKIDIKEKLQALVSKVILTCYSKQMCTTHSSM